ncbi:MAG TPA: hypothetical protein VH682_29220 [Gemmataceae bacterium]|jgi:hypothetical protein
MPSASLADVIATIVFWVVMAFLAGYIFQTACNLCGADLPSFRRGVLITAGVAAAVFFTFDGLGYGIVLATRDSVNLTLPPGYSYWNWLREPLYLKWQVMGLVPILRYLPIAFAVCLAGTLYVIILGEPFRNCIVILLIQWTLNVVAMALLSFSLSTTLRFVGLTKPQSTEAGAETASAFSPQPPETRAATRPTSRRGEHNPRGETAEKKPDAEGDAPPASDNLKGALDAHKGEEGASLSRTREQLQALDKRLRPYIEPIETACQPYTKYLPPVVQEFLEDGGWWLVLGALAVGAGFWLRALVRRLKRALSRKGRRGSKARRARHAERALAIDLDLIADAFTDPGAQQITVRGQPGRLRLVVLAPSSSYVGDLLPEMAESLLDWLQPGLGEILTYDSPRVVVWPRHPSLGRFTEMFHKLVEVPEVKGRRSPWMLLSGATRLGRQTLFLGLAVYLDKTTYQRTIEIAKEKWNDVLGVQKVTEPI